MILLIIFGAQILLYVITDRLNEKHSRKLILIAFIIGHLIIFPFFYLDNSISNEPRCGNNDMGVVFVSFVGGSLTSLVLHTLYKLARMK